MKVLWITNESMALEPVVNSLTSVTHWNLEITHHFYSKLVPSYSYVEALNPDVVFYIGAAEGPLKMPADMFATIREHICPVVHLCCDGACPDWWPSIQQYRKANAFTFQVNMDGSSYWPSSGNDLTTLMPLDPRPYDKTVEKDILLGFVGGTGSKERSDAIRELGSLVTVGPRCERYGTYQDYADFMLRCKFVVNFARSGSGKTWHVKNRVREAGLAKCILLEQTNPITRQWFVDYFEWRSVEDIRTMIKESESKDAEKCLDVSRMSLHRQVTETRNPELFWLRIFSKLGMWPG
jgi:hypothetical protein